MVDLNRAWLLHSRPYKERSVIAEFLVEDHGRIAMVVRGVRQARSANSALLQPFNEVLVSWKGRGELKTLVQIEPSANTRLCGQSLYCGFYINELLMRSLIQGQHLEGVTNLYSAVIQQLTKDLPVEPLLRKFELELLELTGYCPDLQTATDTGQPVEPDKVYKYIPGQGFLTIASVENQPHQSRSSLFSGGVLQALAERNFKSPEYYSGFKRFSRLALLPLIGERPLQSRTLFQKSSQKAVAK